MASTLAGGPGNDVLYADGAVSGGIGNDLLDGGHDSDVMRDGSSTDRFVFGADPSTDQITDSQDGTDPISLGVALVRLTITTVAMGQVQIDTGRDILIVQDADHLPTAANFTVTDVM